MLMEMWKCDKHVISIIFFFFFGYKKEVKLPKEAVDVGISKWEATLVGQFLDKAPPFMVVKQFHGSKEQVLI